MVPATFAICLATAAIFLGIAIGFIAGSLLKRSASLASYGLAANCTCWVFFLVADALWLGPPLWMPMIFAVGVLCIIFNVIHVKTMKRRNGRIRNAAQKWGSSY